MPQPSDIICFAKDWNEPKTSVNHVMQELAKNHRVLWINSISARSPNFGSANDLKKICRKIHSWFHGLQIIHENLRVLTPITLPFPRARLAQYFNRWLTSTLVRQAAHRWGLRQPQLWIFPPNAVDFIGHCDESLVVYYCVDEFTAFSYLDPVFIRQKENELLRQANLVFVVSEHLLTAKSLLNPNTHLISHGVNQTLFGQALVESFPIASELQLFPHPIIGCLGNIYDYFDQEFVVECARLRPQWSFVIVGTIMSDVGVLRTQSNIHLIGVVPYERLPEFCKGLLTGFVAYKPNHPFSLNCNPLKIREYLAAGLPVVSLDIPAARILSDFVQIVHTPGEFIAVIEKHLMTETLKHKLTRSQAMQSESWTARVDTIEHHLANLAEVRHV